MYVYKMQIKNGIVYPSVYKQLNFSPAITTTSGLKRLFKKLKGGIQKDASFFISVGADGKAECAFILTYGFPTNQIFSKELLMAAVLCQASNSIIVSFFSNKEGFNKEETLQDFNQVNTAFKTLTLDLKSYYAIVENDVICISKLFREKRKTQL